MNFGTILKFLWTHPLTRDRRLAALARLCTWQTSSRLQAEIIVPWVSGTKLAVRRGMTGATGNIYVGLHEFFDMGFTLHFLRAGDVFVDIGANVGSYTILASGVCRAKTIAVEPDPTTMNSLRRNLEINGLLRDVIMEQAALGAHAGYANFSVGLDCTNHVVAEGAGDAQRVPMRTLDDIAASIDLTMMKIDVEGYESQVFRGGKNTLQKPSLKVILTEGHGTDEITPLVAAGFERYTYDPFQRTLKSAQIENPGNALFIRDLDFVQTRISTAAPFRVLNRTI